MMRMVMLLADTQSWLNEMCTQTIQHIHPSAGKLLTGKNYRLSICAFAHIIERHYYKTMRHPGTGKFTIPITAIIDHIKEAGLIEPEHIKGSANFRRTLQLTYQAGICKNGDPAFSITVITDATGAIITAYPE